VLIKQNIAQTCLGEFLESKARRLSLSSYNSHLNSSTRTEFSEDDDALLVKYIAMYNPEKAGRQGNAVYQRLEANVCIKSYL